MAVAFLGAAAFFSTVFFSTLGSAFFAVVAAAAGFASFFASFTGPEVPLGRVKSPFSSPEEMARLTWFLNAWSLRLPTLLLAWIYFWMA